MSLDLSAETVGLGPALRWAGAGALVLGVHLGAGALLLDRTTPPRQPDAAVVGMPIDLEPVAVPQDETPPAPAPSAVPPAAQAGEPPPVGAQADAAEPAPPDLPETPPPPADARVAPEPEPPLPARLPDPPRSRRADEAVLARPPPRRPTPKRADAPPKHSDERAAQAAERDAGQQARRGARREASRARTAGRDAAAPLQARPAAEAPPRASASAGEVASWRGALVAHLNLFKRSPPGGASGTARVSFSVTAGGGVVGVRLAASSGDPALDEAALAMVRRADPVPPPPSGMGARVALSVPVHFSGP